MFAPRLSKNHKNGNATMYINPATISATNHIHNAIRYNMIDMVYNTTLRMLRAKLRKKLFIDICLFF